MHAYVHIHNLTHHTHTGKKRFAHIFTPVFLLILKLKDSKEKKKVYGSDKTFW